jgi:hypothetical protein
MKKLFLNSTLLYICAVIFCCCHKNKTTPAVPAKSTGSVKSQEKRILSFKFSGLPKEAVGQINQTRKTVQFTLPRNTDVTVLIPSIQVSEKAIINLPSGQAHDFTKRVVYIVTAEDGSKQGYTVTVFKE